MGVIQVLQLDLRGKTQAEVRAVAEAMGVSYYTLRKIVYGETKDPRNTIVEKIRAYYEAVRPAQEARRAQAAAAHG